ncbi:MAG: ATP-binding cassette domain-containing protein [Pseudomonadales bacterium]
MALVTLINARTAAHAGQAFECAAWQLQRGQKWLIAGTNGSGKTTMAHVLCGQVALSRGEMIVDDDFDANSNIALVSFEQQQYLHERDDRFDDSELREDANDPGTLVCNFLGEQDCNEKIYRDWVEELEIDSLLQKGIRRLSTGQMRRVLIAKAVLSNAEVLILDDPLAGLDRQLQIRFSKLLDRVFEKLETVLVLSSRMDDLTPRFDHLLLLVDGVVVQQGKVTPASVGEARQRWASHQANRHRAVTSWPAPLELEVNASEPLLQLKDVSVSFAENAVFTGLNWVMEHGQHTMISGPNGCGKSTLLAMLTGENPKAYGQQVSLFGRKKGSGESIWDLRKNFGVVSTALQQKYAKGYSVAEVVQSGFQDSVGLYAEAGDQQRDIAAQWLAIVGAPELENRRFDKLSYGQQKLILIARAMVKQPLLLILDEPCIGLDDQNKNRVLELVDEIASNSRSHLLFVSHVSDERPACITQLLQFVWNEHASCYTIDVQTVGL